MRQLDFLTDGKIQRGGNAEKRIKEKKGKKTCPLKLLCIALLLTSLLRQRTERVNHIPAARHVFP